MLFNQHSTKTSHHACHVFQRGPLPQQRKFLVAATLHSTPAACSKHQHRRIVAGVAQNKLATKGTTCKGRVQASTSATAQSAAENVVIVGSGPAGYTAAIYAARANLKPVVFEGLQHGKGGQLMGTTEVENFPGFPDGITGPELMERMRKQAARWGAELYTEDVEHIDLSHRPFTIRSTEREVRAHSVIIATGATAKKLGIPSEQKFWSRGISACAICDGASPLFKGRPVAVVGGGDSACEEAVYLTKYCSHVHLLVRGGALRASRAMQERVLANPSITVHFNTSVLDATGEDKLAGLQLENTATGATSHLDVSGMFYGIGHQPNSGLVRGQVELDPQGYVRVHHGASTSVPGVFSAGDLHDTEWRQAITAAGSGCMAALAAERYLSAHDLIVEVKPRQQQPAGSSSSNGSSTSRGGAHTSEASPKPPPAQLRALSSESYMSMDGTEAPSNRFKGQHALRKLYHESNRLIAVLYTAPTCGPCRTLKPIFGSVLDEYDDKLDFVEIDIETDAEIAEAAGVTGTPTIQLFKDKERLVHLPGVKQKREYRELISNHL